MRSWLVVLPIVVAALVACVNATGAPEARAVTYLLHAEFGIRYEVDWTEETSDQVTDCATWTVDRGTLEVVVGSTKPMRGSLNLFGRYSNNLRYGGWADATAVGAAKGASHRTLVQRGQVNQCGDTPPRQLPVPPNDCAGGRAREYATPNATIRAEMRWNLRALDQVMETVQPRSGRARGPVLAVTAVGRLPYQKCMTSPQAPELPGNIGLAVQGNDVTALRNLKPGESHRIRGQWSGPCKARLPEQSACRFALDVHVDIRRWKPGTRY